MTADLSVLLKKSRRQVGGLWKTFEINLSIEFLWLEEKESASI